MLKFIYKKMKVSKLPKTNKTGIDFLSCAFFFNVVISDY